MSLIGCLFMPHPPIVVPEVGRERVHEAEATLQAMRRAAREAAQLRPDVLVLLSPHAPLDPDRLAVCTASRYEGSLAMFGAPQVRADLEGDPELARAIVERAQERGLPVMIYRDGHERGVLDHGALVPLAFLLEALPQPPALVELNFSFRSPAVHLEFGQAIGEVLDAYSRRVLYVASGDLSHRLTPSAPAGYSPLGADFDRQVVEVFASGNLEAAASIPGGLTEAAGECGYRSLLVLAGLLRGRAYGTRVLSYEGPFGVGYLVGMVDLVGTEEVGKGTDAAQEPAEEDSAAGTDPLVELARRTVETYVREGKAPPAELPEGAGPERAGVFVSLHLPDGSLRGCIGTIAPTRTDLAQEIVNNAVCAATRDPRFAPMSPRELEGLDVSVDVLGEPEAVTDLDQLDPKRYGVIVKTADGRQALLLPDLEGVDTVREQLSITCRKGGIDPTRDKYSVLRFEVVRHH